MHKYDRLAPLLFFDYHQLLNKDDSKSWAEQMNKWFPDTKIKCTQDQLNCYRRGFFQDENFKYDNWLNGNVPVSPDYSFKKDQIKISKGESFIAKKVRGHGYPLVVLMNDGFPAAGSPHERFYKPGGVYFDACSKGQLLLLEPHESAFADAVVRKATEDSLRKKADEKHWSFSSIPIDSLRYRFVALNEIGRMMVEHGEERR